MIALIILLPLSTLLGWLLAKKQFFDQENQPEIKIKENYFKGLNYLINDEPDKAVDLLIEVLKVDSDTIETHVALGDLFRRRGEVERAIRIHRNLIARPQLDSGQKHQVLLALAKDYLSAGILDRAEKIFLELISANASDAESLKLLLSIYEKEKEWERAINIANQLGAISGNNISINIAHYYCELALAMCMNYRFADAKSYLKKAKSVNSHCIRAQLLQIHIAVEDKDYRAALRKCDSLCKKNSAYVVEIISYVRDCYEQLGDSQHYFDFLNKHAIMTPYKDILNMHSKNSCTDKDLLFFLDKSITEVESNPSYKGILDFSKIYLLMKNANNDINLKRFLNVVVNFIEEAALYQCAQCGFEGSQLFWMCPACNTWESIAPVD